MKNCRIEFKIHGPTNQIIINQIFNNRSSATSAKHQPTTTTTKRNEKKKKIGKEKYVRGKC